MINKKILQEMDDEFGHIGSWAIWSPRTKNITSNIGNMELFNKPNTHELLSNECIVVGINVSVHDDRTDGYTGSWQNYHSPYSRGKDHNLRYAFVGEYADQPTILTGTYMTDAIKEHPCVNSAEVIDYIKKNPEELERNMKLLQREIDIIGGKPILIALGGDVKGWLDKYFKDYDVYKITHMSARGLNKIDLRAEVEELEEIIKSKRS